MPSLVSPPSRLRSSSSVDLAWTWGEAEEKLSPTALRVCVRCVLLLAVGVHSPDGTGHTTPVWPGSTRPGASCADEVFGSIAAAPPSGETASVCKAPVPLGVQCSHSSMPRISSSLAAIMSSYSLSRSQLMRHITSLPFLNLSFNSLTSSSRSELRRSAFSSLDSKSDTRVRAASSAATVVASARSRTSGESQGLPPTLGPPSVVHGLTGSSEPVGGISRKTPLASHSLTVVAPSDSIRSTWTLHGSHDSARVPSIIFWESACLG